MCPHLHRRAPLKKEQKEMVPDIVSRYLWVREHGIHVASCITFVRGDNEDDVLRRFGGDPATARWMTLTEVAEESCNNKYPYGYAPLLLVDTINDWSNRPW